MTEQLATTSDPNEDIPSFVNFNTTPVNFFAVEPTGDDATDYERGKRLAEEAMEYARRHRNSMVIALALGHILFRFEISYVGLGFIHRIADAAAAGSMN